MGRLVDCGGEVAQPRQATNEDGAHEAAGVEDLRIAELVAHACAHRGCASTRPAVRMAPRCWEAAAWLIPSSRATSLTSHGSLAEQVEDAKPMRARERSEQRRLEFIDVVHRARHSLFSVTAGCPLRRRGCPRLLYVLGEYMSKTYRSLRPLVTGTRAKRTVIPTQPGARRRCPRRSILGARPAFAGGWVGPFARNPQAVAVGSPGVRLGSMPAAPRPCATRRRISASIATRASGWTRPAIRSVAPFARRAVVA